MSTWFRKAIAAAFIASTLFVSGCLAPTPVQAQGLRIQMPQFITDAAREILNDAQTNLGKFQLQTVTRLFYDLFALITMGWDRELVPAGSYNNRPESYYGMGILPSTVEYTAQLMRRPVRTVDYVADVLHNTNLVPQAYAQGIGFSGLMPVLNVWKAFRNMAYFVFIIIFVIIGFMIMFRKKISSNTVVSIQEALPKIIMTLILITFSYAIAGFVIDLMYLSIYVLVGVFDQAGLIQNATIAANTLFSRNILGIGISYFTGFTEPAGIAAAGMGRMVATVLGGVLGTAANVLFYLIFAIAVLIAVFRTFIQLVMAYIGIIIATIFAPIQLLPNAFPGSDAFEKWIRNLVSNAIVFPVACAIIIIGVSLTGRVVNPNDFIDDSNTNSAEENGLSAIIVNDENGLEDAGGFTPPLLFSQGMTNLNNDSDEAFNEYNRPADSGGNVNAIRALIGFGIIMMLPEVVKMSKEALKVKETYGEAAWKGMSAGWAPVKKGWDTAAGLYKSEEAFKQQARLWDKPNLSPYSPDGTTLTPQKEWRRRGEEYIRRLIGW